MTRDRICVIPGEDAAAEAVINVLAVMKALDSSRATLFGATGGPNAAALFDLRWGKQTFANVRSTRWRAGVLSPLANRSRDRARIS